MPQRSSKRQETDPNRRAYLTMLKATGQEPPTREKNPAAVALGKLGGAKGGKARADKLSARRRSQIARPHSGDRSRRLAVLRRYVVVANKAHSSLREASPPSAAGSTRDVVEQAIEFSKNLIRGRWKMLEHKAGGSPARWGRSSAVRGKRERSGR